jgi:hypothetical protein
LLPAEGIARTPTARGARALPHGDDGGEDEVERREDQLLLLFADSPIAKDTRRATATDKKQTEGFSLIPFVRIIMRGDEGTPERDEEGDTVIR